MIEQKKVILDDYDPLEYWDSVVKWKIDKIISKISKDIKKNPDKYWTFKADWSWDAWEWTRTFGQDKNTVIVLNNNLDHVYDRYIITNQTEDSLSTILEIIQRR